MPQFTTHPFLAGPSVPFQAVVVSFPSCDRMDRDAFRRLAESEIALLKEKYPAESYDRKALWGDNAHYRYFKKFKKTYPVMLQFESVVLKGRPFPDFNPVSEVAFLAELTTFVLSGAHDADSIDGDIQLYTADSKEDFEGLNGTLHTYPGDLSARDSSGIIFSMIAGTDSRTCAKTDSLNVVYPVFCTRDTPAEAVEKAADAIARYAKVLCPDAEIQRFVL